MNCDVRSEFHLPGAQPNGPDAEMPSKSRIGGKEHLLLSSADVAAKEYPLLSLERWLPSSVHDERVSRLRLECSCRGYGCLWVSTAKPARRS